MSTPGWILEIFAVVMILVAEVSAGQLAAAARARARRGGAGIAVSRVLTGIAMAGVLVPGLSTLPDAAWEVVFAVVTAWFAWCLWRESRGRAAAVARGHYAPHLVHSAAVLYIFAALAGPSAEGSMPGMSGMAGGAPGMPALALIFALLLVAVTVHDLDRRAGADGYLPVAGRPPAPAGPAPAATAAGSASGAGPAVTAAPSQPARAHAAQSVPRADPSAHTAQRLLLSPAVVKGCQVATGVTMAFTLITMI